MRFGKTHGLNKPAGQVFSDTQIVSELNQRRLRKPIHTALFEVCATTGIVSTDQSKDRRTIDLNESGLTPTDSY